MFNPFNKRERGSAQKGYVKWARFTGIGLQLGATIYLGSILGKWLDERFPSESISYHNIVTLIAVFVSIYWVIRQVINITKEENEGENN